MKATWALETIVICWFYNLNLSRSTTGKQSSCPWSTLSCSSCSGITSVPRVLLHPQPWKTGGASSGQMPSIRLEPCLPPWFLQGPLGAQYVSLDFIRIKEMSHICKQALLSQSSLAAGRGRRGRKPCAAPCSGRTGSFIIVASTSLQGRAIANKWLAGSQKETIWPTRRTYLHL